MEILDHPPSVYITLEVEERAVKVNYRKKSLLLHPDKCRHPRAQETFEIVKKAEGELMDAEKRKSLLSFVRDARDSVFKRKGIKGPVTEEDVWKKRMEDQVLISAIKIETRRMFAEEENKIKLRLKNEFDRRATEAEEKANERKRKAEHEKLWEETRDERVGNWRQFMKKGAKKKKRKSSPAPL